MALKDILDNAEKDRLVIEINKKFYKYQTYNDIYMKNPSVTNQEDFYRAIKEYYSILRLYNEKYGMNLEAELENLKEQIKQLNGKNGQ